MREQMTDAETLPWRILRNRRLAGAKFRRQHPLGRYILDIYCDEKKLCVELDGGQHADTVSYDHQREARLPAQGSQVLRFWTNVVLTQTEVVVEAIYQAVIVVVPTSPLTPVPAGAQEQHLRPFSGVNVHWTFTTAPLHLPHAGEGEY